MEYCTSRVDVFDRNLAFIAPQNFVLIMDQETLASVEEICVQRKGPHVLFRHAFVHQGQQAVSITRTIRGWSRCGRPFVTCSFITPLSLFPKEFLECFEVDWFGHEMINTRIPSFQFRACGRQTCQSNNTTPGYIVFLLVLSDGSGG